MNSQSLRTFHERLRAAVKAKASLGLTDANQTVRRLQQTDIDHAESSNGTENAAQTTNQYSAALKAFEKTGSMLPVFEGLSVDLASRKKVNQVLRRGIAYLCLLLLVATIGMAWFRTVVMPQLLAVRSDVEFSKPVFAPSKIDFAFFSNTALVAFALLFILLLVWFLTGGTKCIADWLGGDRFIKYRRMSTAAQIHEMLIAGGMASEEALSVSGDLTAIDSQSRAEMKAAFAEGNHVSSAIPWGDYFATVAERQFARFKMVTPILLISVFGGFVALTYCVVIYWPIVSILSDLAARARV